MARQKSLHMTSNPSVSEDTGTPAPLDDADSEKTVDVVLSDMSAPWDQTTGFWNRSLSDPYRRMMNTSGVSFKDHVGSMVCIQLEFALE